MVYANKSANIWDTQKKKIVRPAPVNQWHVL